MRNRRIIVLMIVVVLFVAVMGFSISDRKKLTWPENFILDASGVVQHWFYKPAGYIAGFFEDIANLRHLYQENEELRKTAAAYARDKNKYNFIEQENQRLQAALGFTERQKNMYDYRYLIAQVIAVDNSPINQTIRINLGSKDGITTDMVVVSIDGLVGIVSKVDPFYSNVMPITQLDEKSSVSKSIAATVKGKELLSFGMVDNYDQETGMLSMSRIAETDPLAEGDTIITSGLGEVFPKGMVIGTVKSRQVGDYGLTHTALIDPAADFEHLTEVFVVEVPNAKESAQ